MDEEVIDDSFPYLKELENKIGRKMPESLLIWMRDAAECEDGRRSSEERELSSGLSDSFSEKISTLKRDMVNIPTGFQVLHKWGLCSPVSVLLLGNGTTCTTHFNNHTCVYSEKVFPRCRNVTPIWSTNFHVTMLTLT